MKRITYGVTAAICMLLVFMLIYLVSSKDLVNGAPSVSVAAPAPTSASPIALPTLPACPPEFVAQVLTPSLTPTPHLHNVEDAPMPVCEWPTSTPAPAAAYEPGPHFGLSWLSATESAAEAQSAQQQNSLYLPLITGD